MDPESSIANRTIESLGKVQHSPRANDMELYGGIFFGTLLFPGGWALIGWGIYRLAFDPQRDFADDKEVGRVAFAIVGGLLMLGASIYLFFNVRKIFGYKIVVCEHGFHVVNWGKTTVFAWEDVVLIEETVMHVTVKFSRLQPKSLAEQRIVRGYKVHRADGETFVVDDKRVEYPWQIVDPICAASGKYDIPWKISHNEMTL